MEYFETFTVSDIFTLPVLFVFGLVLVIFLSFHLYTTHKPEYHRQEYWETRYACFTKPFDWYVDFDSCNSNFKLTDLLPSQGEILDLGCGNSEFAVEVNI